MKITFIGATHEVTGSCYYLEAAGKKFLVDCGMEQVTGLLSESGDSGQSGGSGFCTSDTCTHGSFRKPAGCLCERLYGTDLCNTGNLSSM